MKKIKQFFYWLKRRRGLKTCDITKGCGYYIPSRTDRDNPYFIRYELKSGNVGIFELLKCEYFLDPHDMIKKSAWCFVGYEGLPKVKDCSFKDFIKFYGSAYSF